MLTKTNYLIKNALKLLLWNVLYFDVILTATTPEMFLICWFEVKERFIIIINAENHCSAKYFCGNRDTFYFKLKRIGFIRNRNLL